MLKIDVGEQTRRPNIIFSIPICKYKCLLYVPQEEDQRIEAEENVQRLITKKADLETHIQEMVERLDEEVENNANISAARRKLEAELENQRENLDDLQMQLDAVEQEKGQKEKDAMALEAELEKINDNLARSHKEKKSLEERLAVGGRSLQHENDFSVVHAARAVL